MRELTIWGRFLNDTRWGEYPCYHGDRERAEETVAGLKRHRPDMEYVIRESADGPQPAVRLTTEEHAA